MELMGFRADGHWITGLSVAPFQIFFEMTTEISRRRTTENVQKTKRGARVPRDSVPGSKLKEDRKGRHRSSRKSCVLQGGERRGETLAEPASTCQCKGDAS